MDDVSLHTVQMEDLNARQANRRHQMSQWGIDFESTGDIRNAADERSGVQETERVGNDDDGAVTAGSFGNMLQSTGIGNVGYPGGELTQGDSLPREDVRTPRYLSQHTNYEDMLNNMSTTDPFQGDYIPSEKKRRSASKTNGRERDKWSKTQPAVIKAETETSPDNNPASIGTGTSGYTASQHRARKKKRRSKKKDADGTATGTIPSLSTDTFTIEGTTVHVGGEADNSACIVDGGNAQCEEHVTAVKRRKRHKKNDQEVSTVKENLDGESMKSNGTYTLPRSESSLQLLTMSAVSRMTRIWRKKKKQTKREVSRITTGLSAVQSAHSQKLLADFVTTNICQCECSHYSRSSARPDVTTCKCGRSVDWHRQKDLHIDMDSNKEFWHPRNHTDKEPCDSFGEICFQGFGNDTKDSPYLRLDPATDLDKVWTVLTDYWLMPYPTLLISVTGGAKKLHLKPRMKTLFQQGLINAATSTGAWIITGGTCAGVMKCVGEAVRDYLLTADTSEQAKLVALGIPSWGIIANKEALDGEGDQGLFPAIYNIEGVKSGERLAPLDHNHTHFLLVDNGTDAKYGQEIVFRSALEDYISKRVETGVAEGQSVNVPVVLLVLEGGQNTLKTVWETIRRNTPVVIIQGSGRAADIIAQAFKITKHQANEDKSVFPSDFDETIMCLCKRDFIWGIKDEPTIEREAGECVKQIRETLDHRHLINVFGLDDSDSKDIDKCILYALLRANKTNPQSQLALALAWNRCDIARQEIFTHENQCHWQQLNLYDAMFTALVQDRVEFVQLFIDHGVDLKRLTVPTLWNLYANAVKEPPDNCAELLTYWISHYNQSWKDYLCCRSAEPTDCPPDLLAQVGEVIQQLLGEQASNIYGAKRYEITCMSTSSRRPSLKWEVRKPSDDMDGAMLSRPRQKGRKAGKKKHVPEFDNPERELFVWAVLLNRRKLANLFWKLTKDHIGGALMAASLLKAMSNAADDEEEIELSLNLMDHANYFEGVAISVLSECYNKDKRMAHMLLVRELQSWGNTTLFSLADSGMLMDFMENTCCQTKLNIIWKGYMAQYTPTWKIIVGIFFPLMVPAIRFTNNESPIEDLDDDDDVPEDEAEEVVVGDVRGVDDSRLSAGNKITARDKYDNVEFAKSKSRRSKMRKKRFYHVGLAGGDHSGQNDINFISAIYYFYTAPVTKFYCNLISYVVFLCIFSFFLLTDLRPVSQTKSPSISEFIVWGWSLTMAIEEVRQIFTRDPRSVKYKIYSWFNNEWNRVDLVMYSFLILSIILRWLLSSRDFLWARLTYTVTLTLFFLRFMQYFYVEKNMGPKVIMIKKMLTDLMFFFLILFVFVVSFGVAYTANLYPNSEVSWIILKRIVYLPYWQMYGELFLEDVEGDMPDGTCSYNITVYEDDENDLERCPEQTWIVPMLAAIYLLLTNILLVNLLIAMFSYTFERVQENSEKVWRFYRFSLIYEYFDRPSFVPPLIILTHMFRVVKYVCRTGGRKAEIFRRYLSPDENQRYRALEKAAMEKYTTKTIRFEREKMDYKVQNTADRLEQVMAELENIKEQVVKERREPPPEIAQPLETPSSPSKSKVKVQEDIGKLNRRLNQMSDQMAMQSERLDSVLTLLISMNKPPSGSTGRRGWGTTPSPHTQGASAVDITDIPGSPSHD